MTDDQDLAGLDPYDLMQQEAARLDRFFTGLSDADWQLPSRCEGWSVRDVLAHLAASEEYNRACLDGTVSTFLEGLGARGVTDLNGANELGIRGFDDVATSEVLDTWRTRVANTVADFRSRDGGDVDSSVGAYPGRWQAFHLAFELATHADDVAVPVTADEAPARTAWQAKFGRFALKEMKPETRTDAHDGLTRVQGEDVDIELPDAEFVQAVAARLPETSRLDAQTRAELSVTP